MNDKVWKWLFFAAFIICAVLSVLLYRSPSEIANTRQHYELKQAESGCRQKYAQLKIEYLKTAREQAEMLKAMMLKTTALQESNPVYKSLKKSDLEKQVRQDIGRLEVRIEALEAEK